MSDHECEYCGKTGDDVTYEADPYREQIHHDSTPCWMCEECRDQRRYDI